MVIDARDLSFDETIKELKDVVSLGFASRDEVSVFVDARDCEKIDLIKGFAEILLECSTRIVEANGYYILKVIQEPAEQGLLTGEQNYAKGKSSFYLCT